MTESDTDKRGRGILSSADREFLRGEKSELTEQSKRDARYRIRNRLENGFYDIRILMSFLEKRDRKRVFENALENTTHGELFGRLFELPVKGILDVVEPVEHAIEHIEESLEHTIHRSLLDIDSEYMIDVDVSIDVDREKPDMEELLSKYERKEESHTEFRYLLRQDKIEYDRDVAVRSLYHMHEDELLEGDKIHLIPSSDEDPVPVSYEEGADFESFIDDFEQVWDEVMERRESQSSNDS